MDARDEVPVLAVRDVARAVTAFRDVLGLEVLEHLGWMALVGEPGGARVLVVAEAAVAEDPGAEVPGDVIRVA
jgi:catechol 2,3-dioxygenase-like lactoylglutathione lyase family enzyme